jgi:Uma2 family endonuclease
MSVVQRGLTSRPIHYPDSDGKPMAENTLQFRWIVTIQGGLDALFRDDPVVFVAGDLFWYPVEGRADICLAPDAMVVFGRPKGDRGSYRQWVEGDIAPQVVFEVLSPNNRPDELLLKYVFYERYGVEEYYLYDPDQQNLDGWQRREGSFQEIVNLQDWVSPRLGIRFDLSQGELRILRPDGEPFATYLELAEQREQAQRQADEAQRQADEERRQRVLAQQQADEARQRQERLAAQLRALGVEPEE